VYRRSIIYLQPGQSTSSKTVKCLKHKQRVTLILTISCTYHTMICIWNCFRMLNEVSKRQCGQCKRSEAKCENHQWWTARKPLQVSKRRCEPHCGNMSPLIFLECNKSVTLCKKYIWNTLTCAEYLILRQYLLTFLQKHILWHLAMPTRNILVDLERTLTSNMRSHTLPSSILISVIPIAEQKCGVERY
jgi:hypothetical protein